MYIFLIISIYFYLYFNYYLTTHHLPLYTKFKELVNLSIYISKYDYLELNTRSNVHTTIREDLYLELSIMSKRMKEPITKILDILVSNIISNSDMQEELKIKLKNYR